MQKVGSARTQNRENALMPPVVELMRSFLMALPDSAYSAIATMRDGVLPSQSSGVGKGQEYRTARTAPLQVEV